MRGRLLGLLLGLALLAAPPAAAQIAFVQSPTVGTSSASPCATGSATWTAGNAIVNGFGSSSGSTAITGVTASTNTFFAESGAINNTTPGDEVHVALGIAAGTYTVSDALSGPTNQICGASEYSGVSAFGVKNRSTPAATANPSISLTTSAPNSWCVGIFSANDNTAFTAGTGNLRWSGSLAGIGVALVDNGPIASAGSLCTVSVTHASASWGIGVVELYTNTLQVGNGAYSLGGTGTNGYLTSFFNGFIDCVRFTTGANATGYSLRGIGIILGDVGTGNLRGAVYTESAGVPNTLVAGSDSGNVARGTPAGAGTASKVGMPSTGTLSASTPYWVCFQHDGAVGVRVDDTAQAAGTADRFVAQVFGAFPGTLGATTLENAGPHVWASVTANAAAGGANTITPTQFWMRP